MRMVSVSPLTVSGVFNKKKITIRMRAKSRNLTLWIPAIAWLRWVCNLSTRSLRVLHESRADFEYRNSVDSGNDFVPSSSGKW